MAWLGAGIYALITQPIFQAILMFVWNYREVRLGLELKPDFGGIRKIARYSGYDMGFNFVAYLARNADNLLAGKYLGSASLGYYSKAYNLMLYPVSYLTNVITPVLHPILSEHQNDRRYIYDKYLQILKGLSLTGVFITVFCFFASEELVAILYGAQWGGAVPCVKALSLSIWLQMTSSSCGSIYKSLGRTDFMLRSALWYVPIQLAFILAGIASGDIVKLSWLVAASYPFKFGIEFYYLISRSMEYPLAGFFKNLVPELAIAAVTAAAMLLASRLTIDNVALSTLYKFSVCAVAYFAGLLLTRQTRHLLDVLPQGIRKRAERLLPAAWR